MTAMMGQAFVVKLEPGLHASRLTGLMHAFRTYPGVAAVADLAAIDQLTLDAIQLAPVVEPIVVAQPELFG